MMSDGYNRDYGTMFPPKEPHLGLDDAKVGKFTQLMGVIDWAFMIQRKIIRYAPPESVKWINDIKIGKLDQWDELFHDEVMLLFDVRTRVNGLHPLEDKTLDQAIHIAGKLVDLLREQAGQKPEVPRSTEVCMEKSPESSESESQPSTTPSPIWPLPGGRL